MLLIQVFSSLPWHVVLNSALPSRTRIIEIKNGETKPYLTICADLKLMKRITKDEDFFDNMFNSRTTTTTTNYGSRGGFVINAQEIAGTSKVANFFPWCIEKMLNR